MRKNIFVLGMKDWQRAELKSIHHAEQYSFHSLLEYQELIREHGSFEALMDRARAQLRDFPGSIDAIICHWDFPPSCMTPLLAPDYGLPAPSLESVLKCEHKYWARLEQQRAVPECVPAFQVIDPFDAATADQVALDYPFWLKPIKGFASQLGFYIDNRQTLEEALAKTRRCVGEIGRPFNEALAHAELPREIQGVNGMHCIAEQVMEGIQVAPEGYVQNGEVHVHGLLDMLKDAAGRSFVEYRYPSLVPGAVQDHMIDVCRRLMPSIGFDNGCFNAEFLWDEARDKLWLIEINPRISQSHSDLFLKVDGMSNHEVAVSVALGQPPHFPHGKGRYRTAGVFMFNKYGDAQILRVPHPDEVQALEREMPGTQIQIAADEGIRLSDMPNQNSYRYVVGEATIGADSDAELQRKFQQLLARTPFEFSDHRPLNR